MKRITLIFAAVLCCLNIYGQVTLTPSKTEMISGETITVTASGEVSTKSITILNDAPLESVSITPVGFANYVPYNLSGVTFYSSSSKTKFNAQIFNLLTSTPITIKLAVRVRYFNSETGQTTTESQLLYYQVKVNPKPVSVGNQAQSRVFNRDNCAEGYLGGPYTVSVPANTYFASTVAAANTLANNYITANGQTLANQNGTCTQTAPPTSITRTSASSYPSRLCAGPEFDPIDYLANAPSGSTFLWTPSNCVIDGPNNQATVTIKGVQGSTGKAYVSCKITIPGYGIVTRRTGPLTIQQCL